VNFESFKLDQRITKNIAELGYKTPTPIQEQGIPSVMAGKDVMGLAQTGTGKTAAFALPIIHKLLQSKPGVLRAVIIAPTRELAQQIHDAITQYCAGTPLKSVTLYGGVSINPQIDALRKGVDIAVACPGRLLDHIEQRTVNLSHVEVLVLDEADQMFDMGFLPSIRTLLRFIPKKRQTLLFSATMPDAINQLAQDILHKPITVKVGQVKPATSVKQALFPVAKHLKTALLMRLLKQYETESVLVFTRTKHTAKKVAQKLEQDGFKATSLQGNLSQSKRMSAMSGFRDGSIQILVATDIASRGIDVSSISHVINYDIPSTVEAYIHRIGRTGRAAKLGEAFTLITPEDAAEVRGIEKVLGKTLEQIKLDDFYYTASAPAQSRGALGDRPEGRVLQQARKAQHAKRPARRPNRKPRPTGN
jgi:ATP-dependent RNA helicase RhlE